MSSDTLHHETMKHLQIIEIENFKGIKRLAVALDQINFIDGPNGAGKSSVLHAIAAAIVGSKQRVKEWLRKGDETGSSVLTLDNGDVIALTNNKGREKLTVTLAEGERRNKPQEFCDVLAGCIPYFDPLSLSSAPPKQQLAVIESILPKNYLQVKEQLQVKLKNMEQERTVTGRLEKDFKSLAPVEKCEDTSEDVSRLDIQINEAILAESEYKNRCEKIKQMEKEISRLKAENEKFTANKVDIPSLRDRRDILSKQAQQYQQWKAFSVNEKRRLEYTKKYQDLTDQIHSLRDEIKSHDQSATLPIEGVSWSDDGIRIDGKLFTELSTTERVLAATKILANIHDRVKLIMVERGNDLTNESLKALITFALENNLQVLIELKGKSQISQNTIHIVDGQVVDEQVLDAALSNEKISIEQIEDLLIGEF